MYEEQDVNVHFDQAHGGYPQHVDLTVPFEDLRMAEKLRVDGSGTILTDELMFSNDGVLDNHETGSSR